MKQTIFFIALGVFLFFSLSNLHAMECEIVDEGGYAITSAKAGEAVYFKSTYSYKKSKKLSWSLSVSLPSTNTKNNKTSVKYAGYFSHEGSLGDKSRLIPVLIPEDNFIQGTATFTYTLTGNGKCSVNLNITQVPGPDMSGRLKIFVTSKGHIGDFANDPYLIGATGIARADDFCNKDSNKPSSANYKALLVDGINRDAVKMIDWVLQPNTTYYRADNITVIGATTPNAVFPTAYVDLVNCIHDGSGYGSDPDDYYKFYPVWTGLANATNFAAYPSLNCNNWSDGTKNYAATRGSSREKNAFAFYFHAGFSCDYEYKLYCAEQP
jgi:hypothetical protein